MLRHFENAIRAGRSLRSANDEVALAAFAGLIDQGQKAATIASSYGLDVCSPIAAPSDERGTEAAQAYADALENFDGPRLDDLPEEP